MKFLGFEFGRAGSAAADAPAIVTDRRMRVARGGGGRHIAGGSMMKRGFEAARTDRLVASWTTTDQSVNMALHRDLRSMRARSRDFFINSEYGRRFGQLVKVNIVGHAGFALKVDCRQDNGSPDKADSDRVAAAYLRQCKPRAFDVTGRLSEALFDALAVYMVARDGEVLIRFVEGEGRGPHGVQMQLLPGHLLDERHNRDLDNGARIRMGVEFDSFMKPVAYHLRLQSKSADLHGLQEQQRYERVPAEQMLHLFVAEDAEQWRGIPWAFASLRGARHLDQFDEAAIIAANVGAAKMGFFQQSPEAEGAPMGTADVGEAGTEETFTTEATPGAFDVIPHGYEFKNFDPSYPSDIYDDFTKAVVRRIAVGFGLVSTHSISGDLSEVNFSSMRGGDRDEREWWKTLQSWYVSSAKERMFEYWLARALINDPALRALPYTKFDKFNVPVFTGRRWDYVNPKDDIAAHTAAVALKIKSRAQVIRDAGGDPETIWAEIEAEEARGMVVPSQPSTPAQPDSADDSSKPKAKG
jgi:lambda family phage portal protein